MASDTAKLAFAKMPDGVRNAFDGNDLDAVDG
jgi:hypothetical protein